METLIHESKNEVAADYYWVFLSVDPDGTEGIVAFSTALGLAPLATTNPRIMEQHREQAREIRRMTGKKIVIAKFKRESTEAL